MQGRVCAEIQLWGYRDTAGGIDIQLRGIDIQQGDRETAGGYRGTAWGTEVQLGYRETAWGTG